MTSRLSHGTAGLCALLFCASMASAQQPPIKPVKPAEATKKEVKRGESITLNFVNAEIESIARTVAILTGRNLVLDPRVKGVMTLSTETPVAPSTAYNLFLGQLRLQGFTVVAADGIDKIVPEADAKLQGGNVTQTEDAKPNTAVGNQMITQIIRLKYENAANLIPVLRPLINPNNPINVNGATNSLVITDYADNLRRLTRIVEALDIPSTTDLEIIPLQYGFATDMVNLLQKLIDGASTAGPQANQGVSTDTVKTVLLAEPRTNAIILRAPNQAKLNLARTLIQRLDQPTNTGNGPSGNIYVVYLKNASANQIAPLLRAAINPNSTSAAAAPSSTGLSSPTSGSGGSPGGASSMGSNGGSGSTGAGSASSSSSNNTGGQIQADPTTNSLIITATEPQYRQLKAVIDKLDTRRAQVFVESLIAEVSEDKAAQFGIQWQNGIGNQGDRYLGILGTNFGTGGNNLLNLSTALGAGSTAVTPGTGFNVGVGQNFGGTYVLGFLGRFLQSNGLGNVLSTPNLLTLDNEEAKIIIGQNVPFVTGQYTGSAGSNSAFQTIERKDVGLTLKVRPQISENGTIRMSVYQEVSSVLASTATNTNGPTTNKRTIESTVLVEDGNIVVLGGLLQDQYSGTQDAVPGLASIPILGSLFRSESRSRNKTNLMVFLRPVVMRDAGTTGKLSSERYENMRQAQESAKQTVPSGMTNITEGTSITDTPTQDGLTLRWSTLGEPKPESSPASAATQP